jgi:hypothetical protein
MRKTTLSIEDRIRSGGLIPLSPDFCDWASISRVTAYKLIAEGRLKVVKVGRSPKVAGEDAIAFRDALRGVAA